MYEKHGGLGYSDREFTCTRDLRQTPHNYPGIENLVNPVLEKSSRICTSIAASWFMTHHNVTLVYHKDFRHMQPPASDKILIPARMSYSWKDFYFFLLENIWFLGLKIMAVWAAKVDLELKVHLQKWLYAQGQWVNNMSRNNGCVILE
jgi:hypothetical protein